ncbi:MAG TPA: Y-family DNA polymerase [Magnetospirillaceae bacterium]|nr:Y-family DNA polymerase [Magnetospirillaceae bacterium]
MKNVARAPVFALVDCNNFFVSCERVFRPDLAGKPVVVLSNNDACVVARSNESKALGVPMGVPYFEIRDMVKKHNITLFSGNFPLYGDFSQRVVQLLQAACPTVEVYSVDESFLEISDLLIPDYEVWGRELREKILQWTGIPVSIGIAPSKTLAKAAADYVKKTDPTRGAFSVATDDSKRLELLTWLPVRDVWGVGRASAPKMQSRGIRTGYDLSLVSDEWALRQLTIRGLRMVRELRGESCVPIEHGGEPQKTIMHSRSFGHSIRNYYEIEGAVATFAAQAAAKLRAQSELARRVVTYVQHSGHSPYRGLWQATRLHPASNDTGVIIEAAVNNLQQAFDPEFGYKKAGVALLDLHAQTARQLTFTDKPANIDRRVHLMNTIDTLNTRYNTRLVRHASEHVETARWHSKRQLRSQSYTTKWSELRAVR